jgi:hypothetical protein
VPPQERDRAAVPRPARELGVDRNAPEARAVYADREDAGETARVGRLERDALRVGRPVGALPLDERSAPGAVGADELDALRLRRAPFAADSAVSTAPSAVSPTTPRSIARSP